MYSSSDKNSVYLCGIVERMEVNETSTHQVESLLNEGADINFNNPYDNGDTPLHIAIKRRKIDWVRFLIEKEGSKNVENKNGVSAERAAFETNDREMMKAIESFKKIDEKNLTLIEYTEAIIDNVIDFGDVKVLKVEKCLSFKDAKLLLSSKKFLTKIQTSQIFVIIVEINDVVQDSDILKLSLNHFKRPMIIQCSFINSNSLYFTDQNGALKKFEIDQQLSEDSLETQIATEEMITFDIILNLLKLKDLKFCRFGDNFMNMEVDFFRKIRNDTLADLAWKCNSLLAIKLITLFDVKLNFKLNTELVKKAIECGTLHDLKLTLGLFDNKENAIGRPELNRFLDSKFMLLAVKARKLDIVKFLIDNNCGVNNVNNSDEIAADYALRNSDFEILLALLSADSPFPKSFHKTLRRCNKNKLHNKNKLEKLIASRKTFHKMIQDNKIDEVKKDIRENSRIKIAYTIDNQCALTTALKYERFNIYSLLRSEGFHEGVDRKYTETLRAFDKYKREEIKISNRKYFEGHSSIHLQKLIIRSHLGFGSGQENFDTIKKYFSALDGIPEIQPILQVVANAEKLKIIFDFNLDSVCDMDPTQISDQTVVRGRTIYRVGIVLIGAKQTEDLVIATLAHEMTHLAVHILYDNEGLPYETTMVDRRSKFEEIRKQTFDRRDECEIIKEAFGDSSKQEVLSELVARVPQIYAMFRNDHAKIECLKNTFEGLFDYFNKIILKDCRSRVPAIKSHYQIESLNQLLSVYKKCETFKWFSCNYHEEINDIDRRKSNIFVQTNYPELFLACVIRKSKKPLTLQRSHVFVEIEQIYDEKYSEALKTIFLMEEKVKVFIVSSRKNHQISEENLKFLQKFISELLHTCNIIFIAPCLPDFIQKFEKINAYYKWTDLSKKSRKEFLKEKIVFQGQNTAIENIVSRKDFFENVSLEDVLDHENWAIGRSFDEHKNFYIERNFLTKYDNIGDNEITSSDVCNLLIQQKVVVLADDAGRGKSSALIELAEMLVKNCKGSKRKWVVFVDLKKHTKSFLKDNNAQNINDYQLLFANILSLGEFQSKLFSEFYESGRIIFLVDGYDEICPLYSEFTLGFLKEIERSGNFLIITTRPYLSKNLTTEFKVDALSLKPFYYNEQLDYLVKFWLSQEIPMSQKSEESLKGKAETLLEKMSQSLGYNNNFLGNPQIIKMLAHIFSESNLEQLEKEEHCNIFSIYKKFWLLQIEEMFSKGPVAKASIIQGLTQDNFAGIHYQLGVNALFPEIDLGALELNFQPSEEICVLLNRAGLLNASIENGVLRYFWTHMTFAEYFVADFLLENITMENSPTKSKELDVLWQKVFSLYSRGVIRKFINDKLEAEDPKGDKLKLNNRFCDFLIANLSLYAFIELLHDGHASFIYFIFKTIPMESTFKHFSSSWNNGFETAYHRPGNFNKLWPVVKKLLTADYLKTLLVQRIYSSSVLSAVLSKGNELDINAALSEVLELFSNAELKRLLTGQYPGSETILLHSALESKNPELIAIFWNRAVHSQFPREKDQKYILLAKNNCNFRTFCFGFLKASIDGTVFLLEKMKKMLSSEEIKNCFLDGLNQVPEKLFGLLLLATKQRVSVFKIVWEFIEANFPESKKELFLTKTGENDNVLNCCLSNVDSRTTAFVFEIAKDILTEDELNECLKLGINRDFSIFQHESPISFKQFKVICEAVQVINGTEKMKIFFANAFLVFRNLRFDLRIFIFLLKSAKSCYGDDQFMQLFTGNKLTDLLAIIQMPDKLVHKKMLLNILNKTEKVDNNILVANLKNSEKILHIVFAFGSSDLISEVIKIMERKLSKSELKAFLNDRDYLGFNALERSLINNDQSVADLIWCLYKNVFNTFEIKKILLPDEKRRLRENVQSTNIFLLAAIADHPFILTALNFIKSELSLTELEETFLEKNCLMLTRYVAKFCSARTITEYLNFLVKSFDKNQFVQLMQHHLIFASGVTCFLMENESVDSFKLFWSEISKQLDDREIGKVFPKYFLGNQVNFESLTYLKELSRNLFEEKKLSGMYVAITDEYWKQYQDYGMISGISF